MPELTSPTSQTQPASYGNGSKSIFTSRTFAGLALIALPIVAKNLGCELSDADSQQIVEQLFQAVGLVLAAWGRWKAAKALHVVPPPPTSRILFLAIAALLTGCAGTTRTGRVTNAVLLHVGRLGGRVAISTAAEIAKQKAAGLDLDFAHAASQGLWINMGDIVTAGDVRRVVTAYTGGEAPTLGPALAKEFHEAAPGSTAERQAVVASMAQAISDAALALKSEKFNGSTR